MSNNFKNTNNSNSNFNRYIFRDYDGFYYVDEGDCGTIDRYQLDKLGQR